MTVISYIQYFHLFVHHLCVWFIYQLCQFFHFIFKIHDHFNTFLSWLGKMAKLLFIFLFFSFSFLFLFGLTIQERSTGECHITMLYVTVTCQGCHRVMSHDECGRVVYRLYSSCISSIQNLIETPLSSFC